jgi:hypothetical protein
MLKALLSLTYITADGVAIYSFARIFRIFTA